MEQTNRGQYRHTRKSVDVLMQVCHEIVLYVSDEEAKHIITRTNKKSKQTVTKKSKFVERSM